MEHQDKIYLYDFKCLWAETKGLEQIINRSILTSEYVYAYRQHAHILDVNPNVKWFEENADHLLDSLMLTMRGPLEDVETIITSENREPVFKCNLDEHSKEYLLNNLRLSSRNVKWSLPPEENRYLIDDPLYDQYNYLFTKGDRVILSIDPHIFRFYVSKDLL